MIIKKTDTKNEIRIDKEGNWFYNRAPIVNRKIFLLFCKSLEKDSGNGYFLRMKEETCPVVVEDTPFVVVDAAKENDVLKIQINDETAETLDIGTFYINRDNVPYCRIKNGKFPARFLRKAYYRIAEFFEQDDAERFFISLANKKHYVKQEQ